MKLLLDECLPKRLKEELKAYEVKTVPEMGWAGKKNGELIQLAAKQFDVFITADQNITYQQNLRHSEIGIVTLKVVNTRFDTLQTLLPQLKQALATISPGELIEVGKK